MSTTKTILSIFIFLLIASLSLSYFIVPLREINLGSKHSISLPNQIITGNQFYPNMRFPDNNISYKINKECSLTKQNQMQRAFEIIEEKTILEFYPIPSNEEITITCQETERKTEKYLKANFFIAGEGGPTEIIRLQNFSLINKGEILLIRNSKCPNPNIAIHELLHVLGFDHSNNPKDIMYNITECDQEISLETLNIINKIYSIPSRPDLQITNASAYVH